MFHYQYLYWNLFIFGKVSYILLFSHSCIFVSDIQSITDIITTCIIFGHFSCFALLNNWACQKVPSLPNYFPFFTIRKLIKSAILTFCFFFSNIEVTKFEDLQTLLTNHCTHCAFFSMGLCIGSRKNIVHYLHITQTG